MTGLVSGKLYRFTKKQKEHLGATAFFKYPSNIETELTGKTFPTDVVFMFIEMDKDGPWEGNSALFLVDGEVLSTFAGHYEPGNELELAESCEHASYPG